MEINSPDYIIVAGVHKSGTTSLFKYLSDHDQICAPWKKELHHFTPLVYGNSIQNIAIYHSYFKSCSGNKIRLDVSPSYFYGGAPLINELKSLGKIKVILLLRNPTDRFISFYKQGILSGRIKKGESLQDFFLKSKAEFDEFKKLKIHEDTFYNRSLREGCYSLYLEPWLKYIEDKLHIVFFEDLVSRPAEVMAEISTFLGVPNIYDSYDFSAENASTNPRFQRLSAFANSFFLKNEAFFRKNKRLKNLIKWGYQKLNTSKYESISEDVKKQIKEFYDPYNKDLVEILSNSNKKIPRWT